MSVFETETPIFLFLCVQCFQGQPLEVLFDFTVAGVKCHLEDVKHLPALYYTAFFIFIFFGVTESILIS